MDLDFLKEIGEAFKQGGIDSPEAMEAALVEKIEELKFDVDDLDIEWDEGVATVQGMAADQDTREKIIVAIGNTTGVLKVKDELVIGLTTAEKNEIREAAAKRAAEAPGAEKPKKAEAAQADRQKRADQKRNRKALRQEYKARQKRAEESKTVFYTVVKGDSLNKIAAKHYDDSSKWPEIFEANQPMIKDADLIFPGQVLRIPNAK
ncbi:MAG: LysM peptidoglycan-binding domain-containing protein [Acidimicrobiia bacterium]